MIDTRYGVFALGNTSYPHYCGFGKWLDSTLGKLSNGRLTNLGLGDENPNIAAKSCFGLKM